MRPRLTYANVVSSLCLFLVLGGGAAYALDGSNTVFSDDIVNGEVKNGDLAANAVGSGKIADQQVKNADLAPGASSSNTIADGGVQGIDVRNESLTGANIANGSLGGADLGEFRGRGDLDDVEELILAVPAFGLELRTDVDSGVDMQVDIHNVGTSNFQIQFVGQNSSTVTPQSSDPVVAPGDFAASGSDAATLDAVVFKSGVGRVWIQCIFPFDDALCRATVIA